MIGVLCLICKQVDNNCKCKETKMSERYDMLKQQEKKIQELEYNLEKARAERDFYEERSQKDRAAMYKAEAEVKRATDAWNEVLRGLTKAENDIINLRHDRDTARALVRAKENEIQDLRIENDKLKEDSETLQEFRERASDFGLDIYIGGGVKLGDYEIFKRR